MSNRLQRPTFYEGQILGAADLRALTDYPRGQFARHNRFVHAWGIVDGFHLQPPADGKFVLTAGVAIDGFGRELVLSTDKTVDPAEAQNIQHDSADPWIAVFISAQSAPVPARPGVAGGCATGPALSTRLEERVTVTFGRLDEALNLDGQDRSGYDVSQPPPDSQWRVLVGFASRAQLANRIIFDRTTESHPTPLVLERRYAGITAARVRSPGDSLTLRLGAENQPSATVVLSATNGGVFQIGTAQPGADLTEPVLDLQIAKRRLTLHGDLEVTGTIQSRAASDHVLIQSGTAFDGMLLPLPPGVTYDQIGSNKASADYLLTPAPTAPPFQGTNYGMFTSQCEVDPDWRIVCKITWVNDDGLGGGIKSIPVPAACNFTVLVTVPPPQGSNP